MDLAPYRSNLVSLPANLERSPNLADLLPPDVRFFLDGEHKLMRRTKEETRALDECSETQQETVPDFLATTPIQGYVEFLWAGKGPCWEVFFVWQSPKTKLRFIIDARSGNRFFKVPPGVGCVLRRLFPESRSSGTISGLLMKSRFLLVFQGSSAQMCMFFCVFSQFFCLFFRGGSNMVAFRAKVDGT